jgi:hypothetical protein
MINCEKNSLSYAVGGVIGSEVYFKSSLAGQRRGDRGRSGGRKRY